MWINTFFKQPDVDGLYKVEFNAGKHLKNLPSNDQKFSVNEGWYIEQDPGIKVTKWFMRKKVKLRFKPNF